MKQHQARPKYEELQSELSLLGPFSAQQLFALQVIALWDLTEAVRDVAEELRLSRLTEHGSL